MTRGAQEALEEGGWEVPSHGEGRSEQQYNSLVCPTCGGGDSGKRKASLSIRNDPEAGWLALYTCWRKNSCGAAGVIPGPKV